jgi:hypothetical protein
MQPCFYYPTTTPHPDYPIASRLKESRGEGLGLMMMMMMMFCFIFLSVYSCTCIFYAGSGKAAWRSLLWALHTDYDRISTRDTGYFDYSASIVPLCLFFSLLFLLLSFL